MYIAMNRFKVAAGSESDFETVWRNRDSSLAEVPGFVEFRLLRGKANEEAHGLEERIGFSELDEVREFSRRAPKCRRPQGDVQGTAGV
ncbi:hypothetical protein GGE46_005580 [Rhizobium etli]|uniref:ABM domain-containing protein n=1 Tax=Rhizobium etli TaxID=29449 RepID=A0A7W6YA51_RHIET|nr:hypothetical protein [Rhizobium etli]MBB4538792.1 hypothetical protein [Rhizobium etli]